MLGMNIPRSCSLWCKSSEYCNMNIAKRVLFVPAQSNIVIFNTRIWEPCLFSLFSLCVSCILPPFFLTLFVLSLGWEVCPGVHRLRGEFS